MNADHKRRYAPRMPIEDRREQLLDAALSVLARDGYDKVSIEAIAREADVTRPVVYGAYDGLEPLLHALLDRTQQRALVQVMNVLASAGDPTDVDRWVVTAAEALLGEMQEHPDVWRPILGLTAGAPAIVTERIAATTEVIREYVAGAIKVGLELRGGPKLDAEMLSHLVIATGQEFGRLALQDPPRYDNARIISALDGILAAVPKGKV